MAKQRSKAMSVVIFIVIAAIAIIDNTKGIFVPAFKESFNASNTKITLMLTASSLGYIVATYFGGVLCEKLGQRRVVNVGLITIIVSLSLVGISTTYEVLLVGMFLINIGIGFVMIGLNTLIPLIFVSCQALMMNISHCCYGFGSTIGQYSVGKILDNGVMWRYIFLAIAAIFTVVLIITWFAKLPSINSGEQKEKLSLSIAFKEKYMYFYAIALGTYIFGEMGMSNWVVNFVVDGYGAKASTGATILAGFSFLITIGRLFGGFVAEKVGYLQSVIISMAISVVMLFASLAIGSQALILLSATGLFFAIVYPTIVATISIVFKENSSYITGVILTLGSTINMLLNLAIGRLSDVIGTTQAFYLIPISLIVSIMFVVFILVGKREELLGGRN